jgi:hypothetical protein
VELVLGIEYRVQRIADDDCRCQLQLSHAVASSTFAAASAKEAALGRGNA